MFYQHHGIFKRIAVAEFQLKSNYFIKRDAYYSLWRVQRDRPMQSDNVEKREKT